MSKDFWIDTMREQVEKYMKPDTTEDFGFSFSDGSDIPEVIEKINSAINIRDTAESRLSQCLILMNGFLNNLSKEPTKKYLLWPNRAAKVKEFQEKLNQAGLDKPKQP